MVGVFMRNVLIITALTFAASTPAWSYTITDEYNSCHVSRTIASENDDSQQRIEELETERCERAKEIADLKEEMKTLIADKEKITSTLAKKKDKTGQSSQQDQVDYILQMLMAQTQMIQAQVDQGWQALLSRPFYDPLTNPSALDMSNFMMGMAMGQSAYGMVNAPSILTGMPSGGNDLVGNLQSLNPMVEQMYRMPTSTNQQLSPMISQGFGF
jgi:uncharacterized protein (UPF0335 family)